MTSLGFEKGRVGRHLLGWKNECGQDAYSPFFHIMAVALLLPSLQAASRSRV